MSQSKKGRGKTNRGNDPQATPTLGVTDILQADPIAPSGNESTSTTQTNAVCTPMQTSGGVAKVLPTLDPNNMPKLKPAGGSSTVPGDNSSPVLGTDSNSSLKAVTIDAA